MTQNSVVREAPASPVFDHHSEDFARHWPEITAHLRSTVGPVVRTEVHGGYYAVIGHPEALAAANDAETLMSGRRDGVSSIYFPSMPLRMVPLEVDAPLQVAIRRVLNPIFSDRMAESWEPYVRQLVDVHIDQFIESGEGDLVLDLARRVTATTNLALVGVTEFDEVEEFIDAPGITLRTEPGSPEYERAVEVSRNVEALFLQGLAERRAQPQNDVMSVIANLKLDGEGATDEFILRLIHTVVSGGNSTTTSLIGHAFIWLSEHPDIREKVSGDDALLADLLEEIVRLSTPAISLGRTARADGMVGDQPISAGDHVLLCYGAANRDPAVFENPDEVVFGRSENHLAFGWGRHRCLGRSFARSMAKATVGRVLERIPDFTVDVAAVKRYQTIPVVNGVLSVPATFTPGARVGAVKPTETPQLPARSLGATR
ncbi:MAG: cytochrome P450 [Microbacterium sp.]